MTAAHVHPEPADDGHFMRVPVGWVREVGIDAAAVHSLITWRAERTGEWRATRADIADQTGLSPRTVQRVLDRLRAAHWLTSRRAAQNDATQVWHPLRWPSEQVTPRVPEWHSREGQNGTLLSAKVALSSLETVETSLAHHDEPDTDLFGSPTRLTAVPAEPVDTFDAWWSLYPRKVGKKAAEKAYAKALRDTSADRLLQGLQQQLPALTEKAREDGGRFCVHASTWLNEGRWEDTPAPVEQPRAGVTAQGLPYVPSPDDVFDPAILATLPPPPARDLWG